MARLAPLFFANLATIMRETPVARTDARGAHDATLRIAFQQQPFDLRIAGCPGGSRRQQIALVAASSALIFRPAATAAVFAHLFTGTPAA